MFRRTASFLAVLPLAVASGGFRAWALDRPVDEVVVKGHRLAAFTSPPLPLDQLHVYRWNGTSFEPVPFQVDEIRVWQLLDNLDQGSCPAKGDLFDPTTDAVCETNYAFDFSDATVDTDENPGLDANDELVFMARDAGTQRAPCTEWLPGNVRTTAYEIEVSDQTISGSSIQQQSTAWVYVFAWQESHGREFSDYYVQWEPKTTVDMDRNEACRGGDPVAVRRDRACGWARANASSATGQSTEPTLDMRWIGSWTNNRIRYRNAGATGASLGDLVDRAKFRIGMPLQEDEDLWDTTTCSRVLGLKYYNPAAIPPIVDAPIRLIRLSQGTASGITTTRADFYYGTHMRSRIRLRVHAGVGPLRHYPDYWKDATPADLYTALYPADPPGPPIKADVIDGGGADNDPTGQYDSPGPDVYNWNQVETASRGGLVWFIRETRPFDFTGTPAYYYDDHGTGDPNDSPQFESGSYGNHGVIWNGITLNMQDRTCDLDDPDNPRDLWREVEFVVFSQAASRNASTHKDWLERLLVTHTSEIEKNGCGGGPSIPCKPTLNVVDPENGFNLSLSPATTCPQSTAGYSIYRATGLGSYRYLTNIVAGTNYTDGSVRHGSTYKYRVFAHNELGDYSTAADDVTVTALDNLAPNPPGGIVVDPLVEGARVSWDDFGAHDVVGIDIHMATTSGGPYTKITPQSLPLTLNSFTVGGLDPTLTYYIVLQGTDRAGNESTFSAEQSVTPLP